MSKTVANVLYIELRRNSNTAQIVVVPPVLHPIRGTNTPAHILTRQISVKNPRRMWNFYASPEKINVPRSGAGIGRDETIIDAGLYVNDFAPYFSGFSSGGWVLYKKPVAVGMSLDDLEDVIKGDTPNALLRRVLRVREEAGYEEALFASE
jgi:hypothetical protein